MPKASPCGVRTCSLLACWPVGFAISPQPRVSSGIVLAALDALEVVRGRSMWRGCSPASPEHTYWAIPRTERLRGPDRRVTLSAFPLLKEVGANNAPKLCRSRCRRSQIPSAAAQEHERLKSVENIWIHGVDRRRASFPRISYGCSPRPVAEASVTAPRG